MIDRSAAVARRWLPIDLKTIGPEIVSPGISMAIAASCRSTDTRPITALPVPIAEMTALFWPDVGLIVRRRFYELHANDSSKVATATIEKMGSALGDRGKGAWTKPGSRVAARQETSAAIVADLFKLWQDTLPRISGKSKARRGHPLRYSSDAKPSNSSSPTDASKSTPTSLSGRSDPKQLSRKKTLFAGNAGGGRTWATIATLIQCAKMNERRSTGLVDTDARAHRSRMASQRYRGSHAMEIPKVTASVHRLRLCCCRTVGTTE